MLCNVAGDNLTRVLYGVSSERTFSPGDNPNAGRIKPHAKNVAIVTFANTPNATHATSVMFVRGQIIVAFAMSPGENVRSLENF